MLATEQCWPLSSAGNQVVLVTQAETSQHYLGHNYLGYNYIGQHYPGAAVLPPARVDLRSESIFDNFFWGQADGERRGPGLIGGQHRRGLAETRLLGAFRSTRVLGRSPSACPEVPKGAPRRDPLLPQVPQFYHRPASTYATAPFSDLVVHIHDRENDMQVLGCLRHPHRHAPSAIRCR